MGIPKGKEHPIFDIINRTLTSDPIGLASVGYVRITSIS